MLRRSIPTLRASVLVALATWLLGSTAARAGGGASTDAYDGVETAVPLVVHGLVDGYTQVDLDAPSSRSVPFRAFDGAALVPSLGFAGLTLAHAPDPFGFRIDAGVGNVANAFLAYDPARATHAASSRGLSYVTQGFVTGVAPSSPAITFDVGKFATPVGLEDNENLGNWNASRGLLFTLAEPTYHVGARATVQPSQRFALSTFWLNGWNTNVLDGNGMRGFGVAVTVTPVETLEISADYLGGPERAPMALAAPTLTFRDELDVSATYEVSSRASLAATADYGHDAANGGVSWWGVGGYVRTRLASWAAAVVRVEEFRDPQGFLTATPQSIAEGTLTLEATYRPRPFVVVGRVEFRRDQSNAKVYPAGLTHDDTLTASLAAGF